ncbi:MAG: ABC transporter permease [Anaerolineaceae bacterium]|nr:ABC transporter permease [Anaerolineaceae bacterium]
MTLARQKVMWAYIFLAVPLLFFLAIRIYPTFFAFGMSLYNYNPLAADQQFVGAANYEKLWAELNNSGSVTQAAFINTAHYIIAGMPLQLIVGLLIALMLNEIRFMSTLYRVAFFLPFVTSTIAISWVFRWLYQPRIGFFNVVLQTFSLPQQPFLRSPDQALYAIMAVVIWQGLGFVVVIFLAGLKQIPRTYYEAAEVDGASRWQTFWNITLPLLNPSIVYLVVLQTISFLRMFAPVLAMTNQGDGGPLNSTTTVVLRVYREAFQRLNMGYASTLTVALFVIILVITVIQLRLTTRRIE